MIHSTIIYKGEKVQKHYASTGFIYWYKGNTYTSLKEVKEAINKLHKAM